MQKHSINLLQPELIPVQPLWTLRRVVVVWLLVLAGMIAWVVITQVHIQQLTAEFNSAKLTKQQTSEQLSRLEKQVSLNKASPVLQEKLDTLKLLLVNKEALHDKLTDASSTYAAGFSAAMAELAELHHKDISLHVIKMNANNMMFSGVAKTPDAVPSWLAAFEGATFLSGQSFRHFSLMENERKMTEFTVSSTVVSVNKGG